MKKIKNRASIALPSTDKEDGKIFVGDFITTNKNFTVFSTIKNKQVQMDGLSGIVLDIKGDDCLIRFGNGHAWADKCGKLRNKTGKLLTTNQFDVEDDLPIY